MRLIIAGYTGRDQASVRRHISELKDELGVPAPPRVPMIYDLSPQLLRPVDEINVIGGNNSGEAEAVLMQMKGTWYLGLGSDHTDRQLESVSVQKSKQLYMKPVSSYVWRLEEVVERWDELRLKSWVGHDGSERLYQEGVLGSFLKPDELLRVVQERGYQSEDAAIFCGTLPLLEGKFLFSEMFRAELYDPETGDAIRLKYKVRQLKDAEEE